MDYQINKILEFTKSISLKAGAEIVTIRDSNSMKVSNKGQNDIVTSADHASERIVIQAIKEQFPHHGILAEESSPTLSDTKALWDPVWIIDPIDGTTNYARGHHQCAVSIAFADKGEILVGVVYSPFQNEMFWGVKNGGAYLNDKKLVTSEISEIKNALMVIGTGAPGRDHIIDSIIDKTQKILLQCLDLRRLGAASLDICWIACGRVDAFYEPYLNTWDIAAANLIAAEAGAVVGTLAAEIPCDIPREFFSKEVLVANKYLYERVKSLLMERVGHL